MKTVEEVADYIFCVFKIPPDAGKDSRNGIPNGMYAMVVKTLTAFAEERVKEATQNQPTMSLFVHKKLLSEARAEALEEAAKIVETADAPWEEYLERNAGLTSLKAFEEFAAERIRALKDKAADK